MAHLLALLAATTTFGSCPADAVALRPADLPAARRAVLRYATHDFLRRDPDLDPRGAYVTGTRMGTRWAKWAFIARKCGRAFLRRTAVVGVRYPAVERLDRTAPGPCNSCAGLEFLASRTRAGRWVVWYAL